MAEKMDLHDRVEFALRDAGFEMDEASWIATLAEAYPYQPAQAVDVGAIETVIRSMCNGEYVEGRHVLADILHRALTGEKI